MRDGADKSFGSRDEVLPEQGMRTSSASRKRSQRETHLEDGVRDRSRIPLRILAELSPFACWRQKRAAPKKGKALR